VAAGSLLGWFEVWKYCCLKKAWTDFVVGVHKSWYYMIPPFLPCEIMISILISNLANTVKAVKAVCYQLWWSTASRLPASHLNRTSQFPCYSCHGLELTSLARRTRHRVIILLLNYEGFKILAHRQIN
jgi:hypothetical protein